MKKRLLTLLIILGIVFPYGQSIVYAVAQQEPLAENQLKLQTDTAEKKTVLDEDHAKVTASYVETETNYQWTIEFEKKASENESRIRIAIDTTANGFGTVSDIRGQGLSSADADSDELKAMKVENDEKDLDWYYGEVYSNSAEKGTLSFTSEKISEDSGELPLVVAVDQQTSETSDTEQSTDATEEQTVETVEQTTETDGTSEQTSESTEQTTETTEESTEESIAANGSGTRFYRSVALPFANGVGLKPVSESDPFKYSNNYLTSQERFLEHATNDFSSNNFDDGSYDGGQGDLYIDGNIVTDDQSLVGGKIVDGGANWRNYDYAKKDSAFVEGGKIAKTTKVWGDKQNFTNSYLDYSGAYLKKWVEPVTSEDVNQNGTTTYNVYLDVIGESIQNKKPLDIVFVLDRSGSMTEKVNGKRKDHMMRDALVETIEKLFNDDSLDLRVGLVDFGGSNSSTLFSNTFHLSGSKNQVLAEGNTVLRGEAKSGGTPLSLGIKNGYKELYSGNGTPDRNPEKVLIVVGDGMPTYSYSGFRRNDNNRDDFTQWSSTHRTVRNFWTNDSGNQIFRNYETFRGATFASDEYYPTEFNTSRRPTNGSNNYYRYGEIEALQSNHWYGNGSGTNRKENAIHTIAYHHWLRRTTGNTPRVFSIGFGLSESDDTVEKALGRNVLKNIADLKGNTSDPDESYYYDAEDQQDLIDALTGITSELTRTIQNATLTDILGDNVSVVGDGPKINYYKLSKDAVENPVSWDNEAKATITKDGDDYKFSGINLGAGEMMRISYQVTLNEDAQNGRFQTVNTEAYLKNGSALDNQRMYFPSPSIRYLKQLPTDDLDFLIKKVDENGNPLNGVSFELTKVEDGSEIFKAHSGFSGHNSTNPNDEGIGVFYDDQGNRLSLTVGDYEVREIATLPAYIGTDEVFKFSISDKGEFEYYENPNFNLTGEENKTLLLTVVNKVKPLALEFTKIDSHTSNPIDGAEFTIQKWNAELPGWGESIPIIGESSFSYDQLEIGRYKIDEVSPPAGYRASPGYIVLDVFIEGGSIKAKLTYFNNQDQEIEGNGQLNVDMQEDNTVLISFNVENDPVVPLPSTGGQGRMFYYAITALIVSAMLALGFYYYRRTQRRGE